MSRESLEDHLRKTTRHFSARPPEAQVPTLRRALAPASAAAAADALEAALAPAAGAAPPWPLFRGDAARTGFRPSPGPVTALVPVWDAPLGPVIASPVLTARLVIAASADGRLHFLERGTGRRLHEAKVASALESSPALAGDVLHLGTDDGEVVGIDVRDGKEAYRLKAGALVRSSPVVHDGRVLVGVMDTKDAGALVAGDATKGKLLWRRQLGAGFSSPPPPGAPRLGGGGGRARPARPPQGGDRGPGP